MSRKQVSIIAILCAIAITAAFFVAPVALSMRLEWSVSVGDEITYHISVEGWELNSSYTQVPTYLIVYNDSNIVFEIVTLPELGVYPNGDDFRERVIWSSKGESRFLNESEVPWQLGNVVDSMISVSILPTGSWDLIDGFYPDEPPINPAYQSYYAYSGTISFHYGFNGFDIDLTTRLRSEISYETGIPSWISYYRSHGVDSTYNITLIQVGN